MVFASSSVISEHTLVFFFYILLITLFKSTKRCDLSYCRKDCFLLIILMT